MIFKKSMLTKSAPVSGSLLPRLYISAFEFSVENVECGVRSVENEECGKCGVWKTRSVENAGCGKRGVWKMRSVENVECGKCGVWKMCRKFQFSISICN